MTPQARHVTFGSAGDAGPRLEGMLMSPPAASGGEPCPAAVLCHPQPATSTMDDPLIVRLEADLVARGFITLRFNFRGVGASQGQPTDGRLEPLDIAGAVAYLLARPGADAARLCLVGHAFGAAMAVAYARHDPRVGTIAAVGPPIFRLAGELPRFDRPIFFVTGQYDEVCPEFKLAPLAGALPKLRGVRIVEGARHLMRGFEAEAAALVVAYLAGWAGVPGG